MERSRLRTSVSRGDANEDVIGRRLRVVDEDVEIAIGVENAGVDELELGIQLSAPPVLLDEPRVRILGLRVLVERLHPRVRGGRLQVEVALLYVFAVVALRAGQPEETLLQDPVASVPQSESEAESPLPIGDPEEAILAPPVRAAPRVVVREIVPAAAGFRVVLADGPPLALGEVGAPPLPVLFPPRVFLEAELLSVDHPVPLPAHRSATSQKTLMAPLAVVSCSNSSR